MRKLALIAVTVICFLGIFNTIQAGSGYYVKGLGTNNYFIQADAFGRGGTSMAIPDANSINSINPAGLIYTDLTRISSDFLHESVTSKYNEFEGRSYYSNIHSVRLAIPISTNRFVISVGLKPLTRNDYKSEVEGQLSTGNKYTKQISNEGGLSQFYLGFAGYLHSRLYIGASFNYNFARIVEKWRVDFVSDLFIDTTDEIVTTLWGPNFTTGFIYRVSKKLYIGGIYSHSINLTGDYKIEYVFGNASEKSEYDMKVPASWGIGASYRPWKRTRVSMDFFTRNWEKFEINNLITNYNRNTRISAGLELLPILNEYSAFYNKFYYRTGFHFNQVEIKDINGQSISEYIGTVGLGIPFYGGYGRIDLAVGFGKRGSLDNHRIEENTFKFIFSVTGSEKWFVRNR